VTLHLPFDHASFDAVFLQHVAMNIADRTTLYREMRRILVPGGGFATYDLVIRRGAPLYPTPWARDASASLLLTESETRTAPLKKPGMRRSSGAMLPKWRSTGSRLLWPPRADRTKPRVGHGPGLSGHDQQSHP
jgi:SAM-dependent methyltransferase